MMQDLQKTGSRREFLKDGIRTVLVGGFVFGSGMLGWRKISNAGQTSSLVNLPCRDCSILPVCFLPKAIDFKREKRRSPQNSFLMKKGADGGE
ncbi:MAG: hypothetical protein GQ536_09570 [Candidatus Aminicenantes bacterium]|jgi:hypothetical protein|nr:hypothetical protein [Candidatus Aminicenantes bacterium]